MPRAILIGSSHGALFDAMLPVSNLCWCRVIQSVGWLVKFLFFSSIILPVGYVQRWTLLSQWLYMTDIVLVCFLQAILLPAIQCDMHTSLRKLWGSESKFGGRLLRGILNALWMFALQGNFAAIVRVARFFQMSCGCWENLTPFYKALFSIINLSWEWVTSGTL